MASIIKFFVSPFSILNIPNSDYYIIDDSLETINEFGTKQNYRKYVAKDCNNNNLGQIIVGDYAKRNPCIAEYNAITHKVREGLLNKGLDWLKSSGHKHAYMCAEDDNITKQGFQPVFNKQELLEFEDKTKYSDYDHKGKLYKKYI